MYVDGKPVATARWRKTDKGIKLERFAMLKEFRAFAMRSNVLDMAVGIIIGAAFGAIVNSLVNDIIMPIIGYVTGGMDFKDLSYVLKPGATGADGAAIPAVEIRSASRKWRRRSQD